MAYGTLLTDTIKSSTSGPVTFQNTSGTEIGTLCRAWVNFNGTGTVAIRGSFNVSSITDNGTGDYTVNFTNAMPDANYSAVVGGSAEGSSATFVNAYSGASYSASAPTTTAFRFATFNYNSASYKDVSYASVSIFR